MNPFTGLVSILFHVPLIILTHKRPELRGMASVEATAFAYLLSLTWLVCLVLMLLVAWSSETNVQLFGMNMVFSSDLDVTQRLQLMATSFEFGLVGDLAIRSTSARQTVCDNEKNERMKNR